MKSYYNVLRLPLAFLALLLHVIGFARTYLIALRWWYWVTHALLGFLSNLASLRALFWALSSTSYSQLIFLVYLLDNSDSGHLYADDSQACVHRPPSQFLVLTSSIASLAADLDSWMSSNRLSLNPSKTQLIWLGTRQQLLKLHLSLACCTVSSIYLFNFCS